VNPRRIVLNEYMDYTQKIGDKVCKYKHG